MSVKVDSIPGELRERAQWVLWKTVTRDGKPAKVPYQPIGEEAKSNDPATWTTFDAAVKRYEAGGFDGIGYVFSHDDEFVGIDLDGCRNPETGTVADWARDVIQGVCTYCELSPSETGVKLFVRGNSPFSKGKKTAVSAEPICPKAPGIEIYSALRYFCVTGQRLAGVPATCEPRELGWLRERFWPSGNGKPAGSSTPIVERARKYVAKMPPAISGQGGHNQTFAVACALVLGFDLPKDDALALLREYSERCDPPWSETELQHKIESAAEQPGERGYLKNALLEHGSPTGHATPNAGPNDPGANGPGPEGYHLTDLGNAERLVHQHGADLRYCWPWGKWLVWDGKRWQLDDTGAVRQRAKQTVRTIYSEASQYADSNKRQAVARWALGSEKRDRLAGMIDLARSEQGIPILPDQLDADPWLLNCPNGTLDLRTGELREHERGDYITKLCPTPYEPDAACPQWDEFLEVIFNADAQLIGFLQRLCGYCLTGDVSDTANFSRHRGERKVYAGRCAA